MNKDVMNPTKTSKKTDKDSTPKMLFKGANLNRTRSFHARLKEATKNCRIDMHEPDEQGLVVVVSGYHLDNAVGDEPYRNCGEFTVGMTYDNGQSYEWFNLADIIALARLAKP